jgi:hypothetical protein
VNGGDEEVDRLDADERGEDAADPVDQQVAAEQLRRRSGAVGDASEESGTRAMMTRALKMTAERIALCGFGPGP